jgi:two-component system response regulator AtoC
VRALRDAASSRVEFAFARISAAVVASLPHDEALLAVFSGDHKHVDCLLTTQGYQWEVGVQRESWILDSPELPALGAGEIDGFGQCEWLKAPVRVGSSVAGVVAFLSASEPYTERQLVFAEWVAEVVAGLAESGRLPLPDAFPDPQNDGHDVSEKVLEEIRQVLDVRKVFPRISEILRQALPHDRLTMTFHDAGGNVGFQAASVAAPHGVPVVNTSPSVLERPFVLLPELTPEAIAHFGTAEAREFLLSSGFGSFLAVNMNAGTQRVGVEFWSRETNAFNVGHVALARRIGGYIALAVEHERLAESAYRNPAAAPRPDGERPGPRTLPVVRTHSGESRRMVSHSRSWAEILHNAGLVAETDSTVLLIGESGTGKEVVARFIHESSKRRRGPFVAVNCAAIPEQLMESELFGHERGAFTGATHPKPGQVELAAGGVLFLDEVSEMSLGAQAKFLRVLQEREFRRVGGTRTLKADVRLIAATNKDLRDEVREERFRRDLYYRLRVFDLSLPALRERTEDILALSEILLDEIGEGLDRLPATLTSSARTELLSYEWPGNVRELRNVLERASIICRNGVIDASDLSFDRGDLGLCVASTDLGDVERDLIARVLNECGGNKSRAAKRLGLSRMQLYVRLRRYQIDESTN